MPNEDGAPSNDELAHRALGNLADADHFLVVTVKVRPDKSLDTEVVASDTLTMPLCATLAQQYSDYNLAHDDYDDDE